MALQWEVPSSASSRCMSRRSSYASIDLSVEPAEVCVDSAHPGKGWTLRDRLIMVTWSQSRIEDADVFHAKLVALLPPNSEIYGCLERHETGEPHFHAVVRLALEEVNWRNAASRFMMTHDDGTVDTEAVHFSPRRKYQREPDYLRSTQEYCEKYETSRMFGQRLVALSAKDLRKRTFAEIHAEPDLIAAKKMIFEAFPEMALKSYVNIQAYLRNEKQTGRVGGWNPGAEPTRPWRVPEAMEQWRQDWILSGRKPRPVPLLIIGHPRCGKTLWAGYAGARPMVMDGMWNLKNYFAEATHVVLNDVDIATFGNGHRKYWRDVLGGQASFDATDKFMHVKNYPWGFPVILTANYDNDPRLFPEVADYLRTAPMVVVEIPRGTLLYDE
jgi:hypothetical protein